MLFIENDWKALKSKIQIIHPKKVSVVNFRIAAFLIHIRECHLGITFKIIERIFGQN